MEIKQLDKAGWDLLAELEGLSLKPYKDTKGIPTIAMGLTYYPSGKRVTMQDKPITKAKAIELTRAVASHYEKAVWSVTRDDINQKQFNSLVMFAWNVGIPNFKSSGLLKQVNKNHNDKAKITAAFLQWTRSGDNKTILKSRRLKEIKNYFS